MRIEQGVKFGETLRRWRERGARGAADVADLPRAEQLDRAEPGDRLLGCDSEARAPQQCGEAEKVSDRPRSVDHACASVSIASIRGAI